LQWKKKKDLGATARPSSRFARKFVKIAALVAAIVDFTVSIVIPGVAVATAFAVPKHAIFVYALLSDMTISREVLRAIFRSRRLGGVATWQLPLHLAPPPRTPVPQPSRSRPARPSGLVPSQSQTQPSPGDASGCAIGRPSFSRRRTPRLSAADAGGIKADRQ
jgi:hypothetical protein